MILQTSRNHFDMIVHNSLVSMYQRSNFETSNDIVSIISYHEIINTAINQISFIPNKKKQQCTIKQMILCQMNDDLKHQVHLVH